MKRLAAAVAMVALGCGSAAAPAPAAAPTAGLRIVPQGMVGVALVRADHAASEEISSDVLRAKIDAAHAESARVGPSSEGAPGIFFYGFDASRLVYFSGRTHWRCAGLGCWDYVADRLYVVRRGGGVEATLGVAKQIDLYERPGGVRGGMTPVEVEAKYGKPTRTEQLQYVGSERWYYPDKSVLFLNGQVASIDEK